MSIKTLKDLEELRKIGKIVANVRYKIINNIKPGITTKELDAIGEKELNKYGARSAPKVDYNFPGSICISINDEIAHGIPSNRKIQKGDIVNVDVSAELNGYYADTGASIVVNSQSQIRNKLCECSRKALIKGIEKAKAGNKINQIGRAISNVAKEYGFNVIKNLSGHGVGRKLHEEPHCILNYYDIWDKRVLQEGSVLAVETFISTGANYVLEDKNGWTLRTPDRSIGAQFEHTIVVTKGKAIILT